MKSATPVNSPAPARRGKSLPVIASVCALALLLPSMAGAWVINVQYGPVRNENGQSGNASMAGLKGPSSDAGTTWNSFLGTVGNGNAFNGAQATNAALVDSTNHPTPVKLTFFAPEGYAKPGSNTDSLPVFRSCVYIETALKSPIDFVLSGLSPTALYDLYAISGGSPSATYAGTFHVTGAVVSASQSSTNTGPFDAFNAGNTLLFANLAPTADGKLTLTLESGSYRTSNGFQLVEQASAGNAYDLWAAGLTDPAFDADPNKDGIDNGMAWILGASGTGNAAGNLLKLPAISHDLSGALVLTFDRLIASHPIAPLVAQYGGNLSGWTDFAVPASGGSSSDGNLTVNVAAGAGSTAEYDRITVTIPAPYMAAHPATFVRFKAVK